ncbi:MAG: LytR/AlgR family response regulator transcription factor [Romboutsia sp.]|uniref:LytR/AlgR family response regulator transcription factor n=1 Tax=Romboutsia sp. TaxID=1965302 RepID=UPI003F29FEB9
MYIFLEPGMTVYRIVICEDEITQRNTLKNFITKAFEDISNQLEVLEYSSGEELLKENPNGVDIYFLDIQMDKITGMEVAKTIRKDNDTSEIIFVTSLIEYVQEGYKVRAYRYLLKPIKYKDLKEHVLSCINDIIKKRENFIIMESKGCIEKIPINDITYIEVQRKEITIHTRKGNYHTKNSLDKMGKELEIYNFFRCHKSYLINMKHIEYISKNSVIINSEEIPVSKHRISNLKSSFTQVLGGVLC